MKEMDPNIRDIIAGSMRADGKTIRGWAQTLAGPDSSAEARLAQGAYQNASDLLWDAECQFRRAAALHMQHLRERGTR